MTDPIADMLTRIRNAVHGEARAGGRAGQSTLKTEIARILKDEGYIAGFKLVEEPSEGPRRRPSSGCASS